MPGEVIRPYRVKADTCGWIITTAKSPEAAEDLANSVRDEVAAMFEYDK